MMTTIAAIETTIPTTTATTIKITKKHHKIDISQQRKLPTILQNYFIYLLVIGILDPVPSLRVMKAQGTSPHFSSGTAITAASSIKGCVKRIDSTSIELIFSPPA